MTDGGALFTMSYYGASKVVEHYNMMGPVKAALEKDELAWSRYKSYVAMVSGDEEAYRMDNYEGV